MRIVLQQDAMPSQFLLIQDEQAPAKHHWFDQEKAPVQYLLTTAGPQGTSAYQAWLNQGNTGTEVEWLASLRAPGSILDPTSDNILSSGPDGLYATPKWQTTDW